MQLAIVHYHLNRGGVTQVILNQLRALSAVHHDPERVRVVVFYGGRSEAWQNDTVAALGGLDVTLEAIPELEYDAHPTAAPGQLARSLIAAMSRLGMSADDTVVHIHNHNLGKNGSLPGTISQLSAAGFALLLQIHDFAEDFRPENYRKLVKALAPSDPDQLAREVYPQGSAIHYAVLNGRDHKILKAAGVSQLHDLPNPVSDIGQLPDRLAARQQLTKWFGVAADQPYVLYPVRGIRRKNLGELLLWSAMRRDDTQFALTLPPLNPIEQPRYAAWRQLASELALPVHFEVGAAGALEFGENLAAADRVVTTSVAEGFGMVFLETWLAGLSLIGRDLPEITEDFVASGLAFQQLTTEIKVPVGWIDAGRFEEELGQSYEAVNTAYERPHLDAAQFHHEVSQLFADGLLDFARCSARLQAFIVTLVTQDQGRRSELRRLNPVFAGPLNRPASVDPNTIANAQAVRDHYSLESSGMRLQKLYRTVLDSPRCEQHDLSSGSSILDAFLSLQRFNPVRID